MIDKEFLNEFKAILGYIPIFHDDYITKITYESSSITVILRFLKQNAKFFNKFELKEDINVSLKLFKTTSNLEGKWYCNDVAMIISNVIFEKKDNKYEIEFLPSCGIYVQITAKSYEITKIDD